MTKDGNKAPFRTEKRNVHLLVDPKFFRLAKIECAKVDMDLSHATELLWQAWSKGEITIEKED